MKRDIGMKWINTWNIVHENHKKTKWFIWLGSSSFQRKVKSVKDIFPFFSRICRWKMDEWISAFAGLFSESIRNKCKHIIDRSDQTYFSSFSKLCVLRSITSLSDAVAGFSGTSVDSNKFQISNSSVQSESGTLTYFWWTLWLCCTIEPNGIRSSPRCIVLN